MKTTNAVAFLPTHWLDLYPDLSPAAEIIQKPLFAVWLNTSDQQVLIRATTFSTCLQPSAALCFSQIDISVIN